MICVVLGHLGIYQINRFVFTFHLPVFYLITGYYINDRGTYREFAGKKFRTLIVPYLFACAVIVLLSFVLETLRGGPGAAEALEWAKASLYAAGDSYQKPFPIRGIGAIWFLWSTFWGALLLRLLQGKPALCQIAAVLLILFASEMSRKLFWFPLSIQTAGTALLFMYFGYLFRKAKPQLEKIPQWGEIAALAAACLIWAEFVLHFRSFWLVHADLGRGARDVAASLCACAVLTALFRWLEERKAPGIRPLAFLGQYSIMMLCAHIVELDLFPWYIVQNLGLGMGIQEKNCICLVIAGKLFWSVTMTWLMAHCGITRKIFGFPEHS